MDLAILGRLLEGAAVTLQVTVLTVLVGVPLAFAAGFGRLARSRWIRLVSNVYVEVFRGTSALIQVFYLFYVLPLLGIRLEAMVAGVLALALNMGAYGSELVRSSLLAVDPGQREAAIALNMTRRKMIWRIIVPQAIPMMLPPFGNLTIEYLKGTSLLSLITITELAFAGRQVVGSTGELTETYVLVLLIYFAMAYPMILGVRYLERRVGRRFFPGTASAT